MEASAIVGIRFAPTDLELIDDYLQNQINGVTSTIHKAISVVKICDHDPDKLPDFSKIKSVDKTWHYLSPKEYTGRFRKRTTENGFWKITGSERKIKRDRVEIGIKRTLVYYKGRVPNAERTDWVMHEYEITSLPDVERTYVVCKVMNNDHNFVPYAGHNSSPNHYVGIDSNNPAISTGPEVQQPVLQEENFHGSHVNNHLTMPMNQHIDHSPSYAFHANMFSSYNNNNNNVVFHSNNSSMTPTTIIGPQVQHPYVNNHLTMPMNQHMDHSPSYAFDANMFSSYNNNSNNNVFFHSNMTPATITGPQVQQPLQEENYNNFYANHLAMPMHQDVDYSLPCVLDSNTYFIDNNNNNGVQLEAPYATNELEDWSTLQNPNTFNVPFGHQGEETPLDQLDDDFDIDMFFNDDDPYVGL